MIKQRVELMAPAGNFESMMAAIQGGADSVYFGIEQLNMRARATMNFTIEDLPAIAALCARHEVHSILMQCILRMVFQTPTNSESLGLEQFAWHYHSRFGHHCQRFLRCLLYVPCWDYATFNDQEFCILA